MFWPFKPKIEKTKLPLYKQIVRYDVQSNKDINVIQELEYGGLGDWYYADLFTSDDKTQCDIRMERLTGINNGPQSKT